VASWSKSVFTVIAPVLSGYLKRTAGISAGDGKGEVVAIIIRSRCRSCNGSAISEMKEKKSVSKLPGMVHTAP